MSHATFDRSKHVYRNDAFVELVRDAVRFFNGTPVHPLTLKESFNGTGVYALYYTGKIEIYAKYAELNRLSYDYPIYVGKAVPSGWRQSRISDGVSQKQSPELNRRLREHAKSISAVENLDEQDFYCRFMIFENDGSDMIGSVEAALIKLNRPLWNSCLDGFGNHDPGSGRYAQAKSDWDIIHVGRNWSDRLTGKANAYDAVASNIEKHMHTLRKSKI